MLLVSAVPGTESAICAYISPASWTSLLPPPTLHATHLGHHRVPVLTGFPLAIYLTRGSVYVCVCVSVLISPSPSVSTHPFSTSASLFLPCK